MTLLDANSGAELRTLAWVTSGTAPSGIYPTHDGRFLVRTADLIRVYSAAFNEIAVAHLPRSQGAMGEWWTVTVEPFGKTILVEHTATYEGRSAISGYAVLDADTLDPVSEPHSDPIRPAAASGRTTFNLDHWDCGIGPVKLSANTYFRYCGASLQIFLADGELWWVTPIRDEFGEIRSNDAILAVNLYHRLPDPLDLGAGRRFLKTDVYDVAAKSLRCSILSLKVTHKPSPFVFMALSQANAIALIQGKHLRLYQF
ncbi:MAG: hypothetical protein ACRD59_00785 [Candidatus Acidiferrales bacterium]